MCTFTGSHRMPYGHAQILPIDNRRTFKHAFWFLRVWPGALSTRHTWRAIVRPDVYTCNCFLESMGSWLGGPGQKALQTINEFTLFVDFCLIPLSKTCSFDVPAKKLQRQICIHCHEADNRPLRRSLPTGDWKKIYISDMNWLTPFASEAVYTRNFFFDRMSDSV